MSVPSKLSNNDNDKVNY